MELQEHFRGKLVLITGAVGTVGSALVDRLLAMPAVEVVAIDHNESGLFFLGERYRDRAVSCVLGDVRDPDKMNGVCKGVDIIFHAAAVKHVPLCEHYPLEAVQTNILGVQNVIRAAQANHVERVIYTSSDKAVNPTSVMGTSKLMGEQLIKAANVSEREVGQVFSSTRFGNVLGSQGSVVPLFREQIRRGGPVTLTDAAMTRFVMTLDEAVQLVLEAAVLAQGGEVFITKMRVLRIADLARIMVEELAPRFGYEPAQIEIRTVGTRPGEKLYEELMNIEETRRSLELEHHFGVLPALHNLYGQARYDYPGVVSHTVDNPYNSQNEPVMGLEEVRRYMASTGLLD